MSELHWRDPRDGQPWVVRVHVGEPSVFGGRGMPALITFQRWESSPAVILSAELPDESHFDTITDARLMELLDVARARGVQA
jgi:hypothetical protein